MNKRASLKKRTAAIIVAIALAFGCLGMVAGCSNSSDSSSTQSSQESTRTVTVDGTDYEIPAEVDHVAPAIGALTQVTMMLSPDEGVVSATTTAQISDKFKEVLPAYEEGNPNGYDSSDVEQVIESGAQVVYGPSAIYSDEQKQQLADAGIVFIPMNNIATVDGICNTTLAIGEILGGDAETRAQEFVDYWKGNISDAEERTASLTDEEKPTVLNLAYNNGTWTTEAGQSMITSYIEAAGGISLSKDYESAQVSGGAGRGAGGASVDEEQIVAWNPDYIITYSTEATEALMNDPALANVSAVANGHVYTSPKGLYLWSVRSGEGALMTPWIGTKIHPDLFSDVDMVEMTQQFFKEYYSYDLSTEDANAILAGTY